MTDFFFQIMQIKWGHDVKIPNARRYTFLKQLLKWKHFSLHFVFFGSSNVQGESLESTQPTHPPLLYLLANVKLKQFLDS